MYTSTTAETTVNGVIWIRRESNTAADPLWEKYKNDNHTYCYEGDFDCSHYKKSGVKTRIVATVKGGTR
jgi:hypothetical protein